MKKNIEEAISIIEDVRKSMPECTNKAFLKGALNELTEALAKHNEVQQKLEAELKKSRALCTTDDKWHYPYSYGVESALALFNNVKVEKVYTPKPKFNPEDYMVLNPDIFRLDKNQIAVGVRNYSLSGQPCLMEYTYEGKVYERQHTEFIPDALVGKVCSVQVYELKK